MGYKFRTLAVALLAVTTLLPSVKADDWDKESTVRSLPQYKYQTKCCRLVHMSSNSPIAHRIATSRRFSQKTRANWSQQLRLSPRIGWSQLASRSSHLKSGKVAAPKP